jgi:hypothetical protein
MLRGLVILEKLRVLWVTTELLKNTKRILFLLKIEKAERPHCGLTTTEGSQTANLCSKAVWPPRMVGLTASLCIAHGLTTTEAGQTANTSSG